MEDQTQEFRYVEVRILGTNKVIKRSDVTGQSLRQAQRLMDGLNINLNHSEYQVVLNTPKEKLEEI